MKCSLLHFGALLRRCLHFIFQHLPRVLIILLRNEDSPKLHRFSNLSGDNKKEAQFSSSHRQKPHEGLFSSSLHDHENSQSKINRSFFLKFTSENPVLVPRRTRFVWKTNVNVPCALVSLTRRSRWHLWRVETTRTHRMEGPLLGNRFPADGRF